jgi:rhodanese-related sulfurtransferase
MITQLGLASFSASANESFPGRAKYPDVPVYEKAQLKQDLDKVVIVDTRSSYEFSTLRITGAINIPVASKKFEEKIAEVRSKTDKPIVFYCNGRTCMKSYLSVEKSRKVGVKNTFAYDAGVFEWAKANPDKAMLLGKSPIQPSDIIPKSAFNARCLEPEMFSNKLYEMGKDSMVVDVRDKYQRGYSIGFFPGNERWASLDSPEKLMKYIEKAKAEGRTLFIYDEVGKQARWVQYALQQANLQDYYFMEKGARNYQKVLLD